MRSLFMVLLLAPLSIVRRADVPDSRYLDLGARFPAVVALGRAGDATLIDYQWLVTAAHVARGAAHIGSKIRVGDKEYEVDDVILHPSWGDRGPHDIALIHLGKPVTTVKPMGLYAGSSEKGNVATIVGHGAAGTGKSRQRTDDGRIRAATSRVDSVTRSWLYFSFDSPPAGTAMEGAPGAGDSGGPALISVNGQARVAGISSAGFDGMNGPGTYGAVDAFTRVSTHRGWLDSVMTAPRNSRREISRATATLPATPIGLRYQSFLDAVKENAPESIARFVKANFLESEAASRPMLIPNLRRIAGILHGATIEQVIGGESRSSSSMAVKFKTSTGPFTLELVCYYEDHCKLTDWRRID